MPCLAIAMANVIAFMTIYYNTTKVIDINYVFPKQYNKNNKKLQQYATIINGNETKINKEPWIGN